MRPVAILLLLLTMGTYVFAQKLDTVFIVKKARKFKPRQYIMLMFELLDTVIEQPQEPIVLFSPF